MLAMATELGADNSTVMQDDDGDDLWHNDVGAATLLLGVGRAVGVMALGRLLLNLYLLTPSFFFFYQNRE